MLDDFGYNRTAEKSDNSSANKLGNSLDHSDLRARIAQASEDLDETALASAIDEARLLGAAFEWKKELDDAEALLLDMCCAGDNEMPQLEEVE